MKHETNFKNRVYEAVKRIPKGKVSNYKEVARLARNPRAWRAVGNILNKNRNSKIPCHRVIKSDGKIGGYSKGIKKKINLLKKEGIVIIKRKIALPRSRNLTNIHLQSKSNFHYGVYLKKKMC